jgi:hypothetical protein
MCYAAASTRSWSRRSDSGRNRETCICEAREES